MQRRTFLSLATSVSLIASPLTELVAQNRGGTIIFTSRRPPRELRGNIRAWAQSNSVRAYSEDTASHVWRVEFMAFLSRPPRAAEVRLVFYKLEGRTRRYITNESISLSNPNDTVFFHNTVLHRSPDEFMPMENYEVAIAVADARGQTEIARGRIGLVGQVEHHSGVVDFTGSGGPTVR